MLIFYKLIRKNKLLYEYSCKKELVMIEFKSNGLGLDFPYDIYAE